MRLTNSRWILDAEHTANIFASMACCAFGRMIKRMQCNDLILIALRRLKIRPAHLRVFACRARPTHHSSARRLLVSEPTHTYSQSARKYYYDDGARLPHIAKNPTPSSTAHTRTGCSLLFGSFHPSISSTSIFSSCATQNRAVNKRAACTVQSTSFSGAW